MDDLWHQVAKFVFNVSIPLFLQLPTLHYKQTQTSLKIFNSGLGWRSPRRYLFFNPLRNRRPGRAKRTATFIARAKWWKNKAHNQTDRLAY